MTTLMLRIARNPAFEGFSRVGKAFDGFVQAWAEAHAMAREAQRRYPFAIE